MSSPAEYLIVYEGKVQSYCDHYSGYYAVWVWLDGPVPAKDHAREMEKTREVNLAGSQGYLIDWDERRTFAWGWPDSLFFRNVGDDATAKRIDQLEKKPEKLLEMAAPQWVGWEIRWVKEEDGHRELARYFAKRKKLRQIPRLPFGD